MCLENSLKIPSMPTVFEMKKDEREGEDEIISNFANKFDMSVSSFIHSLYVLYF